MTSEVAVVVGIALRIRLGHPMAVGALLQLSAKLLLLLAFVAAPLSVALRRRLSYMVALMQIWSMLCHASVPARWTVDSFQEHPIPGFDVNNAAARCVEQQLHERGLAQLFPRDSP